MKHIYPSVSQANSVSVYDATDEKKWASITQHRALMLQRRNNRHSPNEK